MNKIEILDLVRHSSLKGKKYSFSDHGLYHNGYIAICFSDIED